MAKYITRKEASEILGVSTRTLQRMVRNGRLSVVYRNGDHGPEALYSADEVALQGQSGCDARYYVKTDDLNAKILKTVDTAIGKLISRKSRSHKTLKAWDALRTAILLEML